MSVGRAQGRSITGPGVGPFLAALWALLGISILLWVAAQLVSVFTGHGWMSTRWTEAPLIGAHTIQYHLDVTAGWPAGSRDQLVSPPLVWVVFIVEMLLLGLLFFYVAMRWTRHFMGPSGARVISTTTRTVELDPVDSIDLRDVDLERLEQTGYHAVGMASHPGGHGSVLPQDQPLNHPPESAYDLDPEPDLDLPDEDEDWADDPH